MEHINTKCTPPIINHPEEVKIFLPCLVRTAKRFLHDLDHLYNAIMLEDNRFFIRAYNQPGSIRLDLDTPFDVIDNEGAESERKVCREVECTVQQRKDMSIRSIEWVTDTEKSVDEDDLIMTRYKFLREPAD